MSEDWVPLPLDKPLFANLEPDAVIGHQTAIENGFINELGGHTRFPGLEEFVDLGGNARVYLHDSDGDLIAATGQGQVFRIDRNANKQNVTEVAVSGGERVTFARTDRELLMAAGGPIVRLRNTKTELLSSAAPMAAHIGWLDGFTIAVEINTGRFFHSGAGQPDQWDPLDTFAADGSPDNINALLVTPFRELLLGGPDSIEQFERLPSGGSVPFFRRWASGDGVKIPHGVLFADNALWTINNLTEFVRASGQTSVSASNEIGLLLESIDDWTDAWIGGYPDRPFNVVGQKFILIQAPYATNAYKTKGVTLVYDYRAKRFFSLYGWNAAGVPDRWPGWSHWRLWDRTFVGGEGKIYEVKPGLHRNNGAVQRWLIRTSHIAQSSELICKAFRLRLVRGREGSNPVAVVRTRCSRDGRPFGPWITRTLGKPGERLQFIDFGNFGHGSTFMFEIASTDDCPINLIGADVQVEKVGH